MTASTNVRPVDVAGNLEDITYCAALNKIHSLILSRGDKGHACDGIN